KLFRALVEPESGRHDIRRPVTIEVVADIAKVGWEDIARVAKVFRDPELGILSPAGKVVLTPDTTLDISHEIVFREWDRLREWVQSEFSAAETYRGLLSSARKSASDPDYHFRGKALQEARSWWAAEEPNEVWAERYGGDFPLVVQFLNASE